MNFKPLRDQILVEPDQKTEKTKSGIYIPETHDEEIHTGVVKAVGKGKRDEKNRLEPMYIKNNEKIAYGSVSKRDVKLDGKKYHIVLQESVIGIIK